MKGSPFSKPLKKGALRRTLHVPEGEKIPASKLDAATHSENTLTRKRANLAKAMRHWG